MGWQKDLSFDSIITCISRLDQSEFVLNTYRFNFGKYVSVCIEMVHVCKCLINDEDDMESD